MSSSPALISGLIREQPLCLGCLAGTSLGEPVAVERGLALLGHVLRLHYRTARCSACGETTDVVSVDRRGRNKQGSVNRRSRRGASTWRTRSKPSAPAEGEQAEGEP